MTTLQREAKPLRRILEVTHERWDFAFEKANYYLPVSDHSLGGGDCEKRCTKEGGESVSENRPSLRWLESL